MREETRRERYDKKHKTAKKYPISLCAINFRVDDNLGYLVRSAACFGAERLYVVGHVPSRRSIKASSGSLIDYVEIVSFSTPCEFVDHAKSEEIQIVSAELVEGARRFSTYDFNFDRPLCLVVGNECSGVPSEIISNSDVIYIKMPGIGYCLNTSQVANLMLYKAVTQYEISTGDHYLP
ncbi:MAG TPA: TrmH family RNA methyltransferase [Flavobacteriales bacterium]|nr:TrmH family RNA methyltransferase [Flavobacteriales bacterium]